MKASKPSELFTLTAQFLLLNDHMWPVAATRDSTTPDSKIALQTETEGKYYRKRTKQAGLKKRG